MYGKIEKIKSPNLGGHDPLSFRDEGALGAHAVLPLAVPLVPLQRAHHPVVAAPGAFRGARVLVNRRRGCP